MRIVPAVLLTLMFLTQSSAAEIPITEFAIDPVAGSTYLLLSPDSWTTSQERAEELGGSLVIVDDAVENQWIIDTFATPARNIWIGLTDQDAEGTFELVTGGPPVFTDWFPGEPNDGNGQDYAYFWVGGALQWDDSANPGASVTGLVEIPPCGLDAPTTVVATSNGTDVELSFTNNGPYDDGIEVYRDGTYVTTIADPLATSFSDTTCGGFHTYQLRGRIPGCSAYSEITSVDHGQTSFASTTTPVAIPNADPVGVTDTIDFIDSLVIDDLDVMVKVSHTWVRDLDIAVTSPGGTEVTLKEYTVGAVTDVDNIDTIFDEDGIPYQEDQLPLGVRVQPEGPGAMSDFNGEDTQGFWNLTVIDNLGADVGTLDAWSVIHKDAGSCPITAPIDLTATSVGDDIELAWNNDGNSYTRMEILRDDVVIADLVGSPSAYTDLDPGPGVYDYAVRGVDESITPCCTAISDEARENTPISDLVLRGDGIEGDNDSAPALMEALIANGRSPVIVTQLVECDCVASLLSSANIWVTLGTFPTYRCLGQGEGQLLVDHLSNGGSVYIEGADNWGFCGSNPFWDFDGVDGLAVDGIILPDGDDSLTDLLGLSFAGLDLQGMDAAYNQDQPLTSDWTDQLAPTGAGLGSGTDVPGSNAEAIWMENGAGGGYTVGIYAANPAPYGNVIATSWEFDGYDGDKELLVELYLDGLAGSVISVPQFRRGDVNGDMGFDISDPVFALAALFTIGATPPGCFDAADSNDDGGFDISDAVYSLGALFIPGATPPLDPGPINCGPDPTPDALDCASTPCP